MDLASVSQTAETPISGILGYPFFADRVITTTMLATLDPADLSAIAEVTLPIDRTAPITIQYEPHKHAYVLYSPDPNMRIAGPAQSPQGALVCSAASHLE